MYKPATFFWLFATIMAVVFSGWLSTGLAIEFDNWFFWFCVVQSASVAALWANDYCKMIVCQKPTEATGCNASTAGVFVSCRPSEVSWHQYVAPQATVLGGIDAAAFAVAVDMLAHAARKANQEYTNQTKSTHEGNN
jgi:hypothetical protein